SVKAIASSTPGIIDLDQALKLGPKHLTQTINEVAHLVQKFV
ncbi:MAG TPA: glycerate 2-kinase, partial [Lactobacillus sp.]|nr:glycerate 2-kinase [Lactobacillus sp.]